MYEHLTITKNGAIAKLMLNRPKVRNAISEVTLEELLAALRELEKDEELKVVILGGEGPVFSSGVDLYAHASEIKNHVPQEWITHAKRFLDLGIATFNFEKLLITAVQGAALGFGFDLAMNSDFTIAGESAIFGLPEMDRLSADMYMLLPYMTHMKKAKEVLFMCNNISAAEAREFGLVNRVVPDGKEMEEAEAWAKKLASVPAITLKQTKKSINKAYELSGLKEVFEYNLLAAVTVFQSGDAKERAIKNKFILEHGVKAWLKAHSEGK
ncbi:MAG: enoyl-CoA hydratase/isomerase family protein [Synergistaceae bacterium]|jgi:enoyl-CoA hydratase/carnithine racemase|nr:enoyl-CoA hydratase/isomerase family protein [Synergistaceae bacterium]